MTSEDRAEAHPRDDRERLNLTDPKAMRALAHPLRWALLEALGHAGTLTATQASEMLDESPANCAFHLRTLAKYGFVEEAGGGKGRERPWRQVYGSMSWQSRQGDQQFILAGQALNQVWLDRMMTRARHSLTSTTSWPDGFEDDLGGSASMLYLTPAEARELHAEFMKTFERLVGKEDHRFAERRDPKHRPAGAVPVEFVLLGYPVLDSPALPDDGEAEGETSSETGGETGDNPEAGPGAATVPRPPKMSDPLGIMAEPGNSPDTRPERSHGR